MADGGEGTVQALLDAVGGKYIDQRVIGPTGKSVKCRYGILSDNKTAIIEMAEAAGLHLVNAKTRNPLTTTTFGVGQLMVKAIEQGAEKIIIGVGGSATVDAGMGMAQALGVKFLDAAGKVIQQPGCGGLLNRVRQIDIRQAHPSIGKIKIIIASDVDNPLYGSQGAAYVYGPQKGATRSMVKLLDLNLRHFSQVVSDALALDVREVSGAGAAGGLGFGLLVFAQAKIKSGVALIAQLTGLKRQIALADLVITGEGRIDAQTAFGKTPVGVAKIANRLNVPVIAIGGALNDDSHKLFEAGINGLESTIARDISLKEALKNSEINLIHAAERAMRLLLIGQKLRNR